MVLGQDATAHNSTQQHTKMHTKAKRVLAHLDGRYLPCFVLSLQSHQVGCHESVPTLRDMMVGEWWGGGCVELGLGLGALGLCFRLGLWLRMTNITPGHTDGTKSGMKKAKDRSFTRVYTCIELCIYT